MSSSVSNISFRYHPEDEQLEDYDTSASISTSSISVKSETSEEESSSVLGRLETDKWKIIREVKGLKGRITKSVEEKLEEIKTERLKNQKPKKCPLGQLDSSSVSDSEEPSDISQSLSASDKPMKEVKSVTKSEKECGKEVKMGDKVDDESDASNSQGSSPERSTTPMPSPDDLAEEETEVLATKKGKGLRGMLRRRKGKGKERDFLGKIAYSQLCDNDSDTEIVDIAQDASELLTDSTTESTLARELERLANPSLPRRVVNWVCDWHLALLTLITVGMHWCAQLPDYLVGFVVGVVVLLTLQRIVAFFRYILGSTEPPIKQLKDLLPLKEVPIFRRTFYEIDSAETVFQGWMNEYTREYTPESYHMTLTDTVYARLEGSRLRLSSPRSKVPKRALWNEPQYKLLFNRERLFDISNCRVELKPDGLIHRRCWSKKYPICIVLRPGAKLGMRFREPNMESVDESAPWIAEDKYHFDAVTDESDDEPTPIPVQAQESLTSLEEMSVGSSVVSDDFVKDAGEGFVKVSPAPPEDSLLYLFARTDREKELWFRRLVRAAKEPGPSPKKRFTFPNIRRHSDTEYLNFMMNLSQRTTAKMSLTKEQSAKSHLNTADLSISMELMWINAFIGRLLYDMYRDPDKLVKIQDKIQRKLSTIKLPIFLEQLEVTQLDLGMTVPIVQRATRPMLNASGVWVDLDVVYEGGFRMTVDTKVNLDRIKQMQAESPSSESPKSGSPAKAQTPTQQMVEPLRKSAVFYSDVEDSAETSSEEPEAARLSQEQGGITSTQHKYLRILDKVAQSKYFQQVADYKFIKKLVSGNNLQLVVEVKGLLGTLVLNIPPPPSDRLWYGFRTNPKLWLSAQPKFGQHAVHVISRIIEKKLSLEFQRVLVLPNMDDILIPVMNHDLPS